jgi:hypothetical protein
MRSGFFFFYKKKSTTRIKKNISSSVDAKKLYVATIFLFGVGKNRACPVITNIKFREWQEIEPRGREVGDLDPPNHHGRYGATILQWQIMCSYLLLHW